MLFSCKTAEQLHNAGEQTAATVTENVQHSTARDTATQTVVISYALADSAAVPYIKEIIYQNTGGRMIETTQKKDCVFITHRDTIFIKSQSNALKNKKYFLYLPIIVLIFILLVIVLRLIDCFLCKE